MPTMLHLCCSKRVSQNGKRTKCNHPLILSYTDETFVHMLCPTGHKIKFTHQYFGRFRFERIGNPSIPLPKSCPNCGCATNVDIGFVVGGTIRCGACGITYVWNSKEYEWEVSDVG